MSISSLDAVLTAEEYGGKAESLSKLMAFGVTVPNGFAISKQVLNDFKGSGVFSEVYVNVLKAKIDLLNSENVIVRSSGIGEDSATFSFAGQLDSLVVKNRADKIVQAIKACWSGLSNERLKVYTEQTGIAIDEMGVVVQEFVEPDYAGVTFTRSPYSKEEMYTEYVEGRGERLVSGEVTPSFFSSRIDNKEIKQAPFSTHSLISQCLKLRTFYGHDLDIEWLAKDNEVFFVQARPITTQAKEEVHWTNTNLNENYPDPISPLLYSIARDSYYHYFKNLANLLQLDEQRIRALSYDFSNTVGIWGNRIYYNMTSIHNIMSGSPLKAYFIDAFNKFVGFKDADVSTKDRSLTSSLVRLILRLVKLNFKLEKNVSEIEEMVTSYSDRSRSSSGTRDLFYEFLDLRFHQWYRASLADFFAMIHYKLLGVFSKRFYKEESIGVHNKLVQAIPNLVSTEPLNEVYDISRKIDSNQDWKRLFANGNPGEIWQMISSDSNLEELNNSIGDYLHKWGFRCSGELMFFKKTYIEEPERFIELIQSYLSQEARDPRAVIEVKAKERRQALRDFTKKIIRKRHLLFPLWLIEIGILRLLVKRCIQAISSRERVRYKQAEMYFRFKQVVSQIGESRDLGEDIFYLTYKEIGEMISSSSMFSKDYQSLIQSRKALFKKESEKTFPEHFVTAFGERPDKIVEEISVSEDAELFTGLAASGGRIKATVKVLESVLESEKLVKGDILVTRQTDPGWALVFPMIGGLIVERGGALSHGAIVAREFGIPAVVGVAGITKQFQDGDVVILDGNLGKIKKVKV